MDETVSEDFVNKTPDNINQQTGKFNGEAVEGYTVSITLPSEDEIISKFSKTTGYSEELIREKRTELVGVDNPEFGEAVQRSPINELPMDFDEVVVAQAKQQLDSTGIFLLGEVHGVKENADIIYTLMKQLGCRGLALEWFEGLSPTIEHFLQTGELEIIEPLASSSEGNITAGHFALLRKLKSEGMLEKLILFDPILSPNANESGQGAELRDEGMAANLMHHLDRSIPTLIVAGNVHTNINQTGEDGNIKARDPMGFHLRKNNPSINTGMINYQSGNYFNIGVKTFEGEYSYNSQPSFNRNSSGNYVFNLPNAHPAIVPCQVR